MRVLTMSIRWRLPLTYAAIALIAAGALGAVLLTTLRSYYAQAEWEYLFSNAQAVRTIIRALQQQAASPNDIRAQLENIAFLSQVQIQWLDAENQIIVDTGLPERDILSVGTARTIGFPAVSELRLSEAEPTFEQTWIQSEEFKDRMFTIRILQDSTESRPINDDILIPASPGEPVDFVLPARLTLFGYSLSDQTSQIDMRRSDQSVEVPLLSEQNPENFVRLSQGPAYGYAILEGVAQAWLFASSAAIIVAGLVGLYISQRISGPLLALTQITSEMTAGNLSARAAITSRDEVGTLARSFNDMAHRVEEIIITLRRFVADAAHELHTPLTALRTNLELIADEKHADRQRHFIESALAQVNRLETLTGDLLELSRLEATPVKDRSDTINLSALIRDTIELYASQAEQKDIEFTTDLPQNDIQLRANESQLRRALSNLLENAIKFTPPGGRVQLGLCQNENGIVKVWIQDTGIGIPDDDFPQVFSRFHRGRNAFAYAGSGLGLAIVKAIIDSHAGQVTAEQLTPGTRFTLQFPDG